MGLSGVAPGVISRLRRWGSEVTASPNGLGRWQLVLPTDRHAGGSSCHQPAPGGLAGIADIKKALQTHATTPTHAHANTRAHTRGRQARHVLS
jgi:hypothetical protein